MQVDYEDEDLRRLAYEPDHRTTRWAPNVTKAYRRRIQQLHAAVTDQDLRALKSLHLEKLKGDRAGTWSIRIDTQYRLILRFQTQDGGRIAIVVKPLTTTEGLIAMAPELIEAFLLGIFFPRSLKHVIGPRTTSPKFSDARRSSFRR